MVDLDHAERIAEEIWRGLEQRAGARERTHLGGYVASRCPACKSFRSSKATRCSCGYLEGAGW